MKIDLLGEYDENKYPETLSLPFKINDHDGAIVSSENKVVLLYGISHELNPRMQERRRAEFITRMLNREIAVDHGVVLRCVSEQWQDGRLVISYEPFVNGAISKGVSVSENSQDIQKLEKKKFDRAAYMKEYFRKRKEGLLKK